MQAYLRFATKHVRVLLIAVALILVGGVAHSVHASDGDKADVPAGKHVLMVYDGESTRGILTQKDTFGDALDEAGIDVSDVDVTEPGLDEELVAPTYDITIYRARPVVVIDGANRTKIMSPYRTARQIAEQAKLDVHDEDALRLEYSPDIVRDGALERLVIERATKFTLTFYGKKTTEYTRASTVAEMLSEKDIELGDSDRMSVSAETPIKAGMTIEIWREGKQTVTREEAVKFPVRRIEDANKPATYRKVKTPGKNGTRLVTYELVVKNGREVSKKELKSVTTKEPKEQVEIVGTKSVYTGGPLSEEQIQALGMCESGMTATRNSGNGFYGAFQFMPSTWRKVAPAPYNGVLPHQAPLDAQKQAVQTLLSRSSIHTQFPGCARKMVASGIL